MAGKTLADAVSAYGASVKAKLTNVAILGAPEEQLRAPLEALIRDLAVIEGMAANAVKLVGETALGELKTRLDFAVTVGNALVGFIEIKAPGKGADPRQFNDPHDKVQWDKLKSLPNLIYTDGQSFSLWRDGKSKSGIVHLKGDVEASGPKLDAPASAQGGLAQRNPPFPFDSGGELRLRLIRPARYVLRLLNPCSISIRLMASVDSAGVNTPSFRYASFALS